MARKRKKAAPEPAITRLGMRVEASEARVEAGINIDARHPQYAMAVNDDDPVYTYVSRLTLRGVVTFPAGAGVGLILHGQ